MKAILEFNLPDDKEEYEIISKAFDLHHVLWELDQDLRAKIKYASDDVSAVRIDAYQEIRDKLHELLNENKVVLY